MPSLDPITDPTTDPITDPSARNVRRPTRVQQTGPDKDPVVHARGSVLTVGNGILAVVLITFGLYASGNLPQLDQAFNGLHASLQRHSSAVVSTTMHFGPLLLLGFLFLIVVGFKLMRLLVRPPVVSDAMEWHSAASTAPRPIRTAVSPTPRPQADAASFIRPLHKQPNMQSVSYAPTLTPKQDAASIHAKK